MKKLLTLVVALVMVCSAVFALVACGPNEPTEELTGTAKVVAEASKMSYEDLKKASKEEMEKSSDTFKVVGLTSVLDKTLQTFAKEYDWIKYEKLKGADGKDLKDEDGGFKTSDTSNAYCNSGYKDYALLTALNTAESKYFADFALVQDVRSISAIDGDLLHNFVPSDYKELHYSDDDIQPLKGIYFNKLFWTNKNFENVNGFTLYNIWQLAGTKADKDHVNKISFQNAATEQINMSFLLSVEAPENQDAIKAAYKKFYNKDWSSDKYASAGQQWVTEFVANITRFHDSDGTAMKKTQLESDWDAGYVYYGAFAKMKDAVAPAQSFKVENPKYGADILDGLKDSDGKVNAMDTVQWDWEIEGFNGFMYAMCSQVVNNAKHPYTACLYARFLCTRTAYEGAIYNKDLPAQDETKGTIKVNQYGYYFPASNDVTYALNDWTRNKHIEVELMEEYNYLKNTKISQVNRILGLISANSASKPKD